MTSSLASIASVTTEIDVRVPWTVYITARVSVDREGKARVISREIETERHSLVSSGTLEFLAMTSVPAARLLALAEAAWRTENGLTEPESAAEAGSTPAVPAPSRDALVGRIQNALSTYGFDVPIEPAIAVLLVVEDVLLRAPSDEELGEMSYAGKACVARFLAGRRLA